MIDRFKIGMHFCVIVALNTLCYSHVVYAENPALRGPDTFGKRSLVTNGHTPPEESPEHYFKNACSPMQFQMVAYRKNISDILGTSCPMQPSCGRYAFQAMTETNDFAAFVLMIDRMLRENDAYMIITETWMYGEHYYIDPLESNILWESQQK